MTIIVFSHREPYEVHVEPRTFLFTELVKVREAGLNPGPLKNNFYGKTSSKGFVFIAAPQFYLIIASLL